ncbi:hypothetical protein COU58_03570 [Candidatus Pacearchaeota archaeon CG10_big_fil_rev_8_21_14_0_10_32_42]|nr:MAG: hypothetical protein COU58_03570 [Candidatus Pacearchaeota archaeon CG10_big_fil_rev_8_21_14_0_10_32_42]
MCLTSFDFFIFLNSSSKENLIDLKIAKSANKAPKPPTIATIQTLEGFKITKKPTAKGAEKPNAKKSLRQKSLRILKNPNQKQID